ncbi:MAG: carboxypeptidase regulatory-like domain-containing protein [Bacteroidia bacterium]|nr:carboxypeptidase regulatory-like domain-containing protein [Bacteroidia bacterium]
MKAIKKIFFPLLLFFPLCCFSQKKKNIFDKAGDKVQLTLAKQHLYGGRYNKALALLKDYKSSYPNDPEVYGLMGQAYKGLGRLDKAGECFKLSIEKGSANAESWYSYAQILLLSDSAEKAAEHASRALELGGKKFELKSDAECLLSQCKNAIKFKQSPLPLKPFLLEGNLNSEFEDKNPCLSADGKTLVFTTRRPLTTNDEPDHEGDGKYFEDIYISYFDSVRKNFVHAIPVPGSVNTKAHDACTSISPDGKQIFIYKNDINDKDSRGGDVFVTKINNNKWKTPELFGKPVASSYWEGGACISPDGKRLFFTSERPGGLGGSDIWMVEKISKTEWGKPVNLGAPVNSEFDEGGMFLAPDGKTLFFCSNGPRSMGSYDIFKTVFQNGKWSEPQNLGYPINTTSREGQITISANGKVAYFSSDRPGGKGESDIYYLDLSDYSLLDHDPRKNIPNEYGIIRGVIRDGYEGFGLADVNVRIFDQSGTEVASVTTNEAGEYFVTLKGGQTYKLEVSKKGFKTISENVELKLNPKETVSVEKGYLLKKE